MSNASFFRAASKFEDAMIRAAMPKTAAADPKPTVRRYDRPAYAVFGTTRGVRWVRPLTFKIGEVATHA